MSGNGPTKSSGNTRAKSSGAPRAQLKARSNGARKAPPHKPDSRVQRTRAQLGVALISLITEKPVNDVTVQDVLDRSGVGRSTFYLHYRDKDDLLISQLEMFCETMSTALLVKKEKSPRVLPVAELFAHIGNQNKLYRVLTDSGHLKDFFDLAEGYFARGIERRLVESGRIPHVPTRELAARAAALSGSLLALLRWWLDRGEKESPEQMDKIFHQLVWTGLQ
jgi:AcrR family transcriptional regulator